MTAPLPIPARPCLSKPPVYESVYSCPLSRSRLQYFSLTTKLEIPVQKHFDFVSFTAAPLLCSILGSSAARMLKQLLVLCLKTKPKWSNFAQLLKTQSGFQTLPPLLLLFSLGEFFAISALIKTGKGKNN